MLYDPTRWDTKTPSLEGFISFLKTKNPKSRYNYLNVEGKCPVDQYFTSIGIDHDSWGTEEWQQHRAIWGRLNNIVAGHRTYGAALQEALGY